LARCHSVVGRGRSRSRRPVRRQRSSPPNRRRSRGYWPNAAPAGVPAPASSAAVGPRRPPQTSGVDEHRMQCTE